MTDQTTPALPADKTARELEKIAATATLDELIDDACGAPAGVISPDNRERELEKIAAAATLDELIDDLTRIRAERKRIAKLDEDLVEEWRAAEGALIARLDAQKVNRVSTDSATATITEDDVPMVIDWDVVWDYIIANHASHLMQRRIATAAWRELKDAGIPTPGIDVYKKREISLRKR